MNNNTHTPTHVACTCVSAYLFVYYYYVLSRAPDSWLLDGEEKLKMQFIFCIITHQHRWCGIRHFVAVILWHMPYNSFVTHIGYRYANILHTRRPPCSSHRRKCSHSDYSAAVDSGDNLSNSIRWAHHMSRKYYGTDDNGCYRNIQLKLYTKEREREGKRMSY